MKPVFVPEGNLDMNPTLCRRDFQRTRLPKRASLSTQSGSSDMPGSDTAAAKPGFERAPANREGLGHSPRDKACFREECRDT